MGNRIKKELNEPKTVDLRKQQIMCRKLAEAMRATAMELQLQVSGQTAIEGEGVKLMVIFSCFPNGDLIVWFLDQGYFSLMALVNQKFKHLATFPATETDKFQAELTRLQGQLGK